MNRGQPSPVAGPSVPQCAHGAIAQPRPSSPWARPVSEIDETSTAVIPVSCALKRPILRSQLKSASRSVQGRVGEGGQALQEAGYLLSSTCSTTHNHVSTQLQALEKK